MNWQEYEGNSLWPVLVETVHSIVMYRYHKAYIRDNLLQEQPEINPTELAGELDISLGESLVILYELSKQKVGNSPTITPPEKPEGNTQTNLKPKEFKF